MADIHIADFYKDTAKILVQLYNQFPRPTMLFVEDIAGPDSPDEFGLHSPRHQACLATILWLAKAGYLDYQTLVRQEAVDEAHLTQRGFTLLASHIPIANVEATSTLETPEVQAASEASTQTNGVDLLRQVLQAGSSAAIEQVVLELMRQARHHV